MERNEGIYVEDQLGAQESDSAPPECPKCAKETANELSGRFDPDYLDYRKLFNAASDIVASQQEEINKLEERVRVLEARVEKRDYQIKVLKMSVRDLLQQREEVAA